MTMLLLSSVFSVAFVQAGAMNKGWNFLVTGYAVDDAAVEQGGASVDVSLYSGSAGMTPDSPFYFMDTFFDQFSSPEELTQEKLGEMGVMIQDGSYADAGLASQYYIIYSGELSVDVLSRIDQQEFLEDEYTIYQHDAYVSDLKNELVEAVESGALSAELAAETGIDTVQEDVLGLKHDLIETRDAYVEDLAAQEGISIIEADLQLQDNEADAGVGAYHEQELAEGLPEAGEAFVEIEQELQVLLDSPDVTPEQEAAVEQLLDEVELHLEEAAGSYEDGFLGDAEGQLADAESLLLWCGQIIYEGIDSVPVEKIEEIVKNEEEERQEEIARENEEYDQYLEDMLERYPERAEEIQRDAERMQRAQDLGALYDEQFAELYDELLEEGKTDIEASQIMGERWDSLYLEIYGEPYSPPGFYEDEFHDEEEIEIIPIGTIDMQTERANELTESMREELDALYDQLIAEGVSSTEASMQLGEAWDQRYEEVYGEPYEPSTHADFEEDYEEYQGIDPGSVVYPIYDEDGNYLGVYTDDGYQAVESAESDRGGFVKDHEYVDPVSGNTYVYTDTGYSYTDFLGQEHEMEYSEDFVPEEELQSFEDGSEVYEYTVVDGGEELSYQYTATGYTIVDEEGEEVTTEVYPEGSYETVDGQVDIEIDTFGFEIDPAEGDSIIYEYSPEFKNYVSVDGQVYVPPQGASYHYKNVEYGDGVYEYSADGEKWVYDPGAGVWTSDAGAVYTPYVTSVAPTGYENYGRYESESGKTWNYDDITGEWRSDAGDQWAYYKDEGTWKNTETGVAYNPSLTYQTYNYHEGDSSDRGNYESYTSYGGISWSFDEDSNSWVSSEGETYYVPDYSSYDMGYKSADQTGGDTSGYSYSYYGYHTDYSSSDYSGSSGSGSGSTWSYNEDTGSWESSTGTTYYTPVSTGYYSPDYSSGSSGSSGTKSSEAWSYDSSTGNWVSSSGETHTPSSTYSSGTYSSGDGSSGSYSSSWSSSYSAPSYSGDSGSSSSGSYSYAPSYSDSSTSTGGSHSSSSYSAPSYSSSDSSSSSSGGSTGGGDSGGGSYSAPSGYVSLNLYRRF